MFKKRNFNKDSANPLVSGSQDEKGLHIEKRPVNIGIDLRRDIEEIQSNIKTKKDYGEDHEDQEQKYDKKPQNSMFKTKKINKFTSHILKNLPTKTLENQSKSSSILRVKEAQFLNPSLKSQQINESSNQQNNNSDPFRPNLSNYGLLDKSHFSSGFNNNSQIIEAGKGKTHQEALMDYYIKKRMEEMTKPANPKPNLTSGSNATKTQRQPEAWEEVLQIQKQYLTQQEKIKEYSMQEIQKKLQKLAQETIKTEIQKRNSYLKDLLQNQYERMEYASKKQLKYMKQEKQRIQRELNSKYKDSGRKSFIENIKNQTF